MFWWFDGAFFMLPFLTVLPLGLLALVVLVLAGGRDVDTSGKRSFTLYVTLVSFVAVFTALIASTIVVHSFTDLVNDDETTGTGVTQVEQFPTPVELPPSDQGIVTGDPDVFVTPGQMRSAPSQGDLVARGVVQAGLVLLAAGAVLWFHHRRRREYLDDPAFAGSAAWRADRAYLYVVCFTAILIVLFAAGFGSYNAFQLVSPGVFADGPGGDARSSATQGLLTLAWLTVASLAIFRYFWLQAHPSRIDEDATAGTGSGSGGAPGT